MRGICTILRKITTTMTQELQFIPFESRSDKGWAEAWDLYEESFPRCERWNAQGYDRAFGDPRFEADGIWRGEEFIGILFHWNAGAYRYVEHLAVSPALRGQNMGSKALTAFCRKVGRVILEIDPPVDDISIRRRHFYERLGFVANPYEYIHPSFRKPFTPHQLILMSYPGPLHTTKPAASRTSYGRRCSAIRSTKPPRCRNYRKAETPGSPVYKIPTRYLVTK